MWSTSTASPPGPAFAAYDGTAPIEVSPRGKEEDLSAVAAGEPPAQPHHAHGGRHPDPLRRHPGRIYYQCKRAQSSGAKEAIRALKRRISDLIYARLVADAKAVGTSKRGPGGKRGTTLHPA